MFRIFYLDRDPVYYEDLLSWLPDFCSLHQLNILDMEKKHPAFDPNRDVLLINPDYTGSSSSFMEELIGKIHPVPVLFLSETISLPFVVSIIKIGAHNFLHKKSDKSMLIENIKNLLYQNPVVCDDLCDDDFLSAIVGSSSPVINLKKEIIRLGANDMNIHLCGETGTGKELAARALHDSRIGESRKLIAVNCGAISQNLIESELFGTRRGAFTDARERQGIFECANGSTIFLDEITEMPRQAQVKLLRVLEYGTFTRVGDTKEIKSNFHLITASNRNLREEVEKGNFREDLFYRITSLILQIPPLRDRKEDLGELSAHFLRNMKCRKKISVNAMNKLIDHKWSGNIRELKQVITRAVHMASESRTIDTAHIEFY